MSKISIIIPVLNEAVQIQKNIAKLQREPDIEIIIVDGGSCDKTVSIAKELAVKVIITSQPGRANQMNCGAAEATGDILLFLHVDTQLPIRYTEIIQQTLSHPQIIAGAFELAIDSPQKFLRFVEKMVNLRSRFFSLPYGDQAIFLKVSSFQEIGGFALSPSWKILNSYSV